MKRKQKENAKMAGNVTREIVDAETGEVVDRETVHNMVVEDGRNYMRDVTAGRVQTDVDYMAVGSDGTETASDDSSLQGTESIRKQISASNITAKSNNTNEYFMKIGATEPASQPVDMAEVGLFTDVQGSGIMFSRATFTSFTKTQEFEVRFYYSTAFKDINQ